VHDPRTGASGAALAYGAAVVVLVLAPEPLRRVLHTARLPDSLLRQRLDALSALARTRYREVLLWHTHYTFGNAAVMGVFPRLRYVLLSDLLLESMDDREIEAVFAHELGHVVHRHTLWYLAFIVAVGIVWSLLASGVAVALHRSGLPAWADTTLDASAGAALLVGAVALFGAFSRRVERQADVFAARAMQLAVAARPGGDGFRPDVLGSPVGPHGAEALASALHRAAVINNMPVSARSFRHGSIARRIAFIRSLAYDPSRTFRFDRAMRRLYAAVGAALVVGGLFAAWVWS
jgi:STE24 endopeptidase